MKVIRLDLTAIGPFTDASLNFDCSDNPIHIVYGRNEAGKSSCLRALRYWLFGIPHQTNDNFVHPHGKLRIGGVVEDQLGKRLQMIRRKGRTNTLRGADDSKTIDSSEIHQLLNGLDAQTFEKRFGLDHQELVRGGREIASGGGELGEILFAAGSGITELPKIQDDLDQEMRDLFAPKRPSATLNSAVRELGNKRTQIKNLSLSSLEWQQHQQALETAVSRRSEIEKLLHKLRSELSRLNRIKKSLPVFGEQRATKAQLSELSDAKILPQDFTERRSRAVTALDAATQSRQEAELEIQRLQQLMAGIELPTDLLQHQAAIHGLYKELGSHQKAAKDRPRLIAEIRLKEEDAKKHLRDLGWDEDISQLQHFQLSRLQRSRFQDLAKQFETLSAQRAEREKTQRRLSQLLEDFGAESDAEISAENTANLKRAIQRALALGNIEKQIEETQAELTLLETRAAAELDTLPLGRRDLGELSRLPLPMMETIDRFQKLFIELDDQMRIHAERLDEYSTRLQQVQRSLHQLTLEQDVPTEKDLLQARKQRDVAWSLLRKIWQGEISQTDESVVNYLNACNDETDLLTAFESALKRSDAVADRLRREASRVAEKVKLTAEAQELLQRIDLTQSEAKQLHNKRESAGNDWKLQWQPAGIDPLSPHEMAAWKRKADELSRLAAYVDQLRMKVSKLNDSMVAAIEELRRTLQAAKPNLVISAYSLSQWLEQSQETLQALEEARQDRRDRLNQLKKIREDLRANAEELADTHRQMETWEADWSDAIAVLNLSGSPNCSEVLSLLQTIDELLAINKNVEESRRRVEGIDRDAQQFSQQVDLLLSAAAPDLELPVDQAVIELQRRLEDATRTQTRLGQWQEQLCSAQARLEKAKSDYQRWCDEIQRLCQLADCSDADQMPIAEQRSADRQRCEQRLQQLERDLDQLAAPDSIQQFLAVVEVSHVDSLAAEIQQTEEKIQQLETEFAEASQQIGSQRTIISRMDGSDQAAQAQEEAEQLLADIRFDAEQYVRLRLAWKVLKESIDRFRQSSQGPILTRAGELFSKLTLGSFSRLQADYDDKGQAILVGIRPNENTPIALEGMSDGSRDQLYLALRLALLESYLRDHPPVPLILDDILIQFDDDRSTAALQILSEIAELTQVIFFTHHKRLVDLAKQTLPAPKVVVHEL